MKWFLAVLGLLASLALSAQGEEGSPTAKEIGDCIRKNAPSNTMRQRMQIKTVDRMGDEQNYDVKGEWKRKDGRSKIVLRVSAPPDLRGSAFLLIEQKNRDHDMFSYLPELDKVRRIQMRSARASLFGTDISYEDFERMQNFAEGSNAKRLEDAEVEGRAAYVLEGTPTPEEQSRYDRVVSYIDQERCVPLKAELFAGESDKPVKTLNVPADKVSREGEAWIPMEMTMEDLENETHSVITVKDIDLDIEIPDRNFSQSALLRRR